MMKTSTPLLDQHPAMEIVLGLHHILRLSRAYELENEILQGILDLLHPALLESLREADEAALRIKHRIFFWNRTPLKSDYGNYHVFKFLAGEFESRGFSGLVFRPGLSKEELGRFLHGMARSEERGPGAFEALSRTLAAPDSLHIALEAGAEESGESDAAKIYLLGLHLLRGIFSKSAETEAANLNIARRWLQSVIDEIIPNEAFAFGLTNIKERAEYAVNHAVNVCLLSLSLGSRLELCREELIDLGLSSLLHDLGEMDVDRSILNKPGALDEKERTEMEKHIRYGAQRLLRLRRFHNVPAAVIQVVYEHHARVDLTGYPHYRRKKRLHLFSRIVKIADTYDALTSRRVFRPRAFTKEEALQLMLEKSGQEYDPLLLKVFMAMIGAYPIGSLVALQTGELGIVVESNAQAAFALRPKVKLITDAQGNTYNGGVVDLTDLDPRTRRFRRTIIKALDPDRYGISVADYFLPQAR